MKELLEIAGLVVEAITEPVRWYEVVDRLADRFGCLAFGIFEFDVTNLVEPRVYISEYLRIRSHLTGDPSIAIQNDAEKLLYDFARSRPPNHVFAENEAWGLGPYDELPANPIRAMLEMKLGVRRRYGIRMNSIGPWLDWTFLHCDVPDANFSAAVKAELSLLSRCFDKSLETGRILRGLHKFGQVLLDVIDQLDFGVAIFDERGILLVANPYFRRVIEDRDGLMFDSFGRMTCSDPTESKAAREMLNASARTNLDIWSAARVISRRSGRRPYVFQIGSVTDRAASVRKAPNCSILFLIDPEDPATFSTAGIDAFGLLTASESVVCRNLVEGFDTSEIAERRSVSLETVRQQIKSVMAKLNCNSRLDVVRVAMATHVPVRSGTV